MIGASSFGLAPHRSDPITSRRGDFARRARLVRGTSKLVSRGFFVRVAENRCRRVRAPACCRPHKFSATPYPWAQERCILQLSEDSISPPSPFPGVLDDTVGASRAPYPLPAVLRRDRINHIMRARVVIFCKCASGRHYCYPRDT